MFSLRKILVLAIIHSCEGITRTKEFDLLNVVSQSMEGGMVYPNPNFM